MKKQSFIGHLFFSSEKTPNYDGQLSSTELKRHIRKHPGLSLPRTKENLAIAEGVDKLKSRVPNVSIRKVIGENNYAVGTRKIRVEAPHSLTAGHEFGHAVDLDKPLKDILHSKDTTLKLESNASNNILNVLPKSVKRSRGKELAYAYNTYDYNARLKAMAPSEVKSRAKVFNKASKGTKKPNAMYEPRYIGNDALVVRKVYSKSFTDLPHKKALDIRMGGNEVRNNRLEKKVLNTRGSTLSKNREIIVNNIANKFNKQDHAVLRDEVLKYISTTRKEFGNDVARSAINDIREVRKEVLGAKKKPLLSQLFQGVKKFKGR